MVNKLPVDLSGKKNIRKFTSAMNKMSNFDEFFLLIYSFNEQIVFIKTKIIKIIKIKNPIIPVLTNTSR